MSAFLLDISTLGIVPAKIPPGHPTGHSHGTIHRLRYDRMYSNVQHDFQKHPIRIVSRTGLAADFFVSANPIVEQRGNPIGISRQSRRWEYHPKQARYAGPIENETFPHCSYRPSEKTVMDAIGYVPSQFPLPSVHVDSVDRHTRKSTVSVRNQPRAFCRDSHRIRSPLGPTRHVTDRQASFSWAGITTL